MATRIDVGFVYRTVDMAGWTQTGCVVVGAVVVVWTVQIVILLSSKLSLTLTDRFTVPLLSVYMLLQSSGIFTSHSVLFSNLIGPPGLLLHWITCIVTGNGLGKNEALENEESNNQLLINQSEEGR